MAGAGVLLSVQWTPYALNRGPNLSECIDFYLKGIVVPLLPLILKKGQSIGKNKRPALGKATLSLCAEGKRAHSQHSLPPLVQTLRAVPGAVSPTSVPKSPRSPLQFFPSLERYHFPSSKCRLVSYFYFMPFESNQRKPLFGIRI